MIVACTFDPEKGILLYQGQIRVPHCESSITAIIQIIHNATISGHPGRNASLAKFYCATSSQVSVSSSTVSIRTAMYVEDSLFGGA